MSVLESSYTGIAIHETIRNVHQIWFLILRDVFLVVYQKYCSSHFIVKIRLWTSQKLLSFAKRSKFYELFQVKRFYTLKQDPKKNFLLLLKINLLEQNLSPKRSLFEVYLRSWWEFLGDYFNFQEKSLNYVVLSTM